LVKTQKIRHVVACQFLTPAKTDFAEYSEQSACGLFYTT
jgi:hypothetical protein